MKRLQKIIKNSHEYNLITDKDLKIVSDNIDVIAEALNDVEIPTKVSELDNDSGFVESSAIADMETKTHANNTYQQKGDYLIKSDIDPIKEEVTNIINGKSAVQFVKGDDVSKIILDFLATITPPYEQEFMSLDSYTTETLKNIPTGQHAGFVIRATCMWNLSAPGTPQNPNWARSAILELTNASNSSEVSGNKDFYKYVTRIANGSSTKPSTYPTIAWQKIMTDKFAYSKTEMDSKLNGKQATISDLTTIRNGAKAGATAVQPATLTDYATKQYVDDQIGDIETLLSNIIGHDS